MKSIFLAAFVVANVALFSVVPQAQAETLDQSAFTRYTELTVNSSVYTGGELTDFPLLVRLSAATVENLDWSEFAADGADLRFTDAQGNLLAHEIDTWNPDGTSFIWVKVPKLAAGTKIKAWWGAKSGATLPTVSAADVWSDYAGVWHMGETVANPTESAGKGLVATVPCATELTESTTAAIGRATKKDSNGVITAPSFFADGLPYTTSTDAYSVSVWMRAPDKTTAGESRVLSLGGWGAGWYVIFKAWSNTQMSFIISTTFVAKEVGTPDPNGKWIQALVTRDGQNTTFYMNGVQKGTSTQKPVNYGTLQAVGRSFDVDELRVRQLPTSADWALADYQQATAADFLMSVGVMEVGSSVFKVDANTPVLVHDDGVWKVSFDVIAGSGEVFALLDDGSGTVATNSLGTCESGFQTKSIQSFLAQDTAYRVSLYAPSADPVVERLLDGVLYNGAVSIAKGVDADSNTATPGTFVFSIAKPQPFDIPVAYSIAGGTAVSGTDYEAFSNEGITIPAGSTSATLSVTPITVIQTGESPTLSVALAAGMYGIAPTASSATITFADFTNYDLEQWTLVEDGGTVTISDGLFTFVVTILDETGALSVGARKGTLTSIREVDFQKPIRDADGKEYRITTFPYRCPAFYWVGGVYSRIKLPTSLTTVGSEAFRSCGAVIDLPTDNNLETIGDRGFHTDSTLLFHGDIVLPKIKTLGAGAMFANKAVTSIEFGRHLTEVGAQFIQWSSALTNVIFRGQIDTVPADAFANCGALRSWTFVNVPSSLSTWSINTGYNVRAFVSVDNWSSVMNEEAIAAGTFTPWAECTDANKKKYFDQFGADARVPIGYTTVPKAMCLLSAPCQGLVIIFR